MKWTGLDSKSLIVYLFTLRYATSMYILYCISSIGRMQLGIRGSLATLQSCTWCFSVRRDRWIKRLEIGLPYKPVESPFQIAERILESFGPILLFIEALCNRVIVDLVIFNPANMCNEYYNTIYLVCNTKYYYWRNFSLILSNPPYQTCYIFVLCIKLAEPIFRA